MIAAIESSSYAFSAACWHLHQLQPQGGKTAVSVLNPRDPRPRIAFLATGSGAVTYEGLKIKYDIETSDPLPTDGKPEPYRRLLLHGPHEHTLRRFLEDSLKKYACFRAGGEATAAEEVPYWSWDEDSGMWCRARGRPRRPLNTLFLGPEADDLVCDFKHFCSPEAVETYKRLHVTPTRLYMLHGIPGSGKSSLVHCIASDAGQGVAVLSFGSGTTDADVRDALASLPPNCIACIEDVDCLFDQRMRAGSMTFGGLLAALDGAGTQGSTGCSTAGGSTAIFLTTNRLCALDPALRRRLDYVLEFGRATEEQCCRMFHMFFAGHGYDFEELYEAIRGVTFSMSVLQKFFVKALSSSKPPLACLDQFHSLLACTRGPDLAVECAHVYM